MLTRLADWLGSCLLEVAAYLLRYAERRYGPQVSVPSSSHPDFDSTDDPSQPLPPRIRGLLEDLERDPE